MFSTSDRVVVDSLRCAANSFRLIVGRTVGLLFDPLSLPCRDIGRWWCETNIYSLFFRVQTISSNRKFPNWRRYFIGHTNFISGFYQIHLDSKNAQVLSITTKTIYSIDLLVKIPYSGSPVAARDHSRISVWRTLCKSHLFRSTNLPS